MIDSLAGSRAVATPKDVSRLIEAGHVLIVAGEEATLSQLPAGRWIGGTTAWFLLPDGVGPAQGRLIYTDLTGIARHAALFAFDETELPHLSTFYPPHGFAVLLLPGRSALLERVATSMLDWDGLYNAPLTGWVSGVALEALGQSTPKIFCGNGTPHDDRAALLYVTLPNELYPELSVINPFGVGAGPGIVFPDRGYASAGLCRIGGETMRLRAFLDQAVADPGLPLIADRDGALVNNTILNLGAAQEAVEFLCPLDPGLMYRFAEPLPAYEAAFARAARDLDLAGAVLSALCIGSLRHLTAEMRRHLPAVAPVTFGQIGYTVLTQTLTCLNIHRLDEPAAQSK
ncbi:DUF6976 family protein [Acidocella facilis]|uniref:DUF6976 family protein n=1 Tax=Acidocella facilis TaxID=525 RepID=UPI001F21F880|nr:hypothetical protein [Acidocella facilis]